MSSLPSTSSARNSALVSSVHRVRAHHCRNCVCVAYRRVVVVQPLPLQIPNLYSHLLTTEQPAPPTSASSATNTVNSASRYRVRARHCRSCTCTLYSRVVVVAPLVILDPAPSSSEHLSPLRTNQQTAPSSLIGRLRTAWRRQGIEVRISDEEDFSDWEETPAPTYSPPSPAYNHNSPERNPSSSPLYQPHSPDYSPGHRNPTPSPTYSPPSPAYDPYSPNYNPERNPPPSPLYEPRSPDYSPGNPSSPITEPNFNENTPASRSPSPSSSESIPYSLFEEPLIPFLKKQHQKYLLSLNETPSQGPVHNPPSSPIPSTSYDRSPYTSSQDSGFDTPSYPKRRRYSTSSDESSEEEGPRTKRYRRRYYK